MNQSDSSVISNAASSRNPRRLALLACASLFLCATLSSARIASIRINELIAQSDAIVIATVSEVSATSASGNEVVYATGLVQRSLKGSLNGNFRFVASAGWICDTSGAVKDETALFFLGLREDGSYYIQHAGRGRMPFREVDGKTYVTLWDDIVLPQDAPKIAGPESKYTFIDSVELEYIATLVKQAKL